MNTEQIYDDEQDEQPVGFVVDTPEKADWAVEKIRNEQSAADTYISVCKAKIAELEYKIGERQQKLIDNTDYLLNQLGAYMTTAPVHKTKTGASFELPSGKIKVTFASEALDPDRAKLTELLADTGYVEFKPSLRWAEYKKTLKIANGVAVNAETGEIAEGVGVVETPEKIEVKE